MAAEPLPQHEQHRFLDAVFGQEVGYLFISTKDRSKPNDWNDRSFVYPLQTDAILAYVNEQDAAGLDVYVAAQLYKEPNRRLAKNVKACPSVWADLDTACPWGVDPEPNIVLETSPGRWHGFWRTPTTMDGPVAEEYARQIAYAHHRAGADLGGWDLTQVLRIPGTHNHKYEGTPVVLLKRCDPKPIPLSAFAVLPAAPKRRDPTTPSPDDDGDPPIPLQGEDLLHWQKEAAPDRSAWAMHMVAILKEHGLSDRLVELALANHPIYLAKAREKWGNRESLIYDDIRRCIQHWKDHPVPILDMSLLRPKADEAPKQAQEPLADVAGTPLEETPDDTAVPWRVFNAEEFLAIEYPPVTWRIDGYLREKAILFAFGPPGTIKTYIATDAALAIASGGLFLGRFPVEQGRVLIVQEDTLASDYQSSYLAPMLRRRNLMGADVRETLFIAPQADFSLDQQERIRDLCDWLAEHKPDLLVIDSFYLMYSGRKEDLITVMKILKRIRNKFGCAIWIIDHNRKSQGKNSEGEDSMDRLINGREKSAAVDAIMEFRRVKGQDGAAFIDMLKLRGSKLPESMLVSYNDGAVSIDGDKPETVQGSAKTVYDWMCREGGSRTKKQIASGCDLSERAMHYAVGELEMAGLLKRAGKHGRADTWIAIHRADAQPRQQPEIEFNGDDDASR